MRGDPLRVCHNGHPVFIYIGESCPFCVLLKAVTELRWINQQQAQEIRQLRKDLDEVKRA